MTDQQRIDLDQIEQAASQATPGPWDVIDTTDILALGGTEEATVIAATHFWQFPPTTKRSVNDAEHIANCDPQTVLALVRVVRAAVNLAFVYEEVEPLPLNSYDRQQMYERAWAAFDEALAPFRKGGA